MNEQQTIDLPPLSDAAVARIEHAVFDAIADETQRHPASAAKRPRRRPWLAALGVAAAFGVGVLVAPPILQAVSGWTGTSGGVVAVPESAVGPESGVAESATNDSAVTDSAGGAGDVATQADSPDREVIATAQATLRVADIPDAADAIAALAADHGGYVESTDIGGSAAVTEQSDPSMPAPEPAPASEYGSVTIRVPSDDLTAVIDELAEHGEVVASSIARQDVTSTTIDLRARIDATRASVQRLTELMSQSGTVSELIEAEVALTDRQAQLESYEQQLAAIEDQIAMSSLHVQLTPAAEPTRADPAGFGDGLLAGWNGLVVSLNALVIALGFALPWLVVAGVALLLVWAVRRAIRRRRTAA